MKKLIIAALAASMLATPVLAAPRDHRRAEPAHRVVHVDRHVTKRVVVQRNEHRGWRQGERFDRRRATNYRVISAPRSYHLRDAPRGYRWVQSGNDAVLIGITSGIVASVLANVIR